ncbi:MAG: hypothetical protein COU47_01135 [Candidatus Niyogibacteria bacterium CG10_big_fil_rev_8_21_14_0_10_46_36]|uniref:AAA+ ATPase domain-containing protein n=1 Tax=Candidatus Niyogibacteria bacterium CG10_big_fil_rev_8_21_14_0_10_46_36 TaxID=1974726 RepID=A0A2H0TDP8_9BACT|nr:MAG: hypothetical protein COU47_01135 [Candidatus Niyogibacteria bacterium CG10_big_fil_rev_8_21_14_0_10_46_36]
MRKKKTDKKGEKAIIALPPDVLRVEDYSHVIERGALPPDLQERETYLNSVVIGQERAINKVLRALTIYEAGLNSKEAPVTSLIFGGPPGVGKTELALQIAAMWNCPAILIACGDLGERHEASFLKGAPPGYVGYDEESPLERIISGDKDAETLYKSMIAWMKKNKKTMEALISKLSPERGAEASEEMEHKLDEISERIETITPRAVVIYDEIEKADHAIQRACLQPLDKGYMTLMNGMKIPFQGVCTIFTTNVGTEEVIGDLIDERHIGFSLPATGARAEQDEEALRDYQIYQSVIRKIEDTQDRKFYPEFLSRIGGRRSIVVFRLLNYEQWRQVMRLMLKKEVYSKISDAKVNSSGYVDISCTPQLEDFIVHEGISPRYGARNLKPLIQKYVSEEISVRVLNQGILSGDQILLDVEFKNPHGETYKEKGDAHIVVRRTERPAGGGFCPFKKRETKNIDVTKELDDFLQELFDKYLNFSVKLSSDTDGASRDDPPQKGGNTPKK